MGDMQLSNVLFERKSESMSPMSPTASPPRTPSHPIWITKSSQFDLQILPVRFEDPPSEICRFSQSDLEIFSPVRSADAPE